MDNALGVQEVQAACNVQRDALAHARDGVHVISVAVDGPAKQGCKGQSYLLCPKAVQEKLA